MNPLADQPSRPQPQGTAQGDPNPLASWRLRFRGCRPAVLRIFGNIESYP
jgi:hypothetical protein